MYTHHYDAPVHVNETVNYFTDRFRSKLKLPLRTCSMNVECHDRRSWLMLARVKVFNHYSALTLFVHSHEVTGIVHASLGMMPVGIH